MELNRTRATALAAAALAAAGSAGIAGVMSASSKDKAKSSQTEQQASGYGAQPGGPGGPGGDHGRRGGPGRDGKRGGRITDTQLAAIAKKLDVTSAKLKAAVKAAHEANKPAEGAKPEDRRGPGKGDMAKQLATALGVSEDDVEKVLEANRPERGAGKPTRGAKPDTTALVSALAKGLNKDEATVKAAIDKLFAAGEAERTAHRDAEFAAIAKELGLQAADVKAAFESVLPKRAVPSP